MKFTRRFTYTRLHAAIALILGSSSAQALVYETHQLNFSANNQSIWNAGASQAINVQGFAGFDIPSFFIIKSILGADAVIGIAPGGKIGLNIAAGFDSGSVNAGYSAAAKFNIVDGVSSNTFATLGTASVNNISSGFSTTLGNPYYYEDFIMKFPLVVNGQICAFGYCAHGGDVLDVAAGPLELASLNRNGDGKYSMWGLEQNVQFDQPFPVNIGFDYDPLSFATNIGSITVHNPAINTSAASNSGSTSSSKTTDMIDLKLDIGNLLSLTNARGPTNLQVGLGPFSVDLTPYALNATTSLSLQQDFSLNSNMMVNLHFNHLVTADLGKIYDDSSIRTTDDLIIPVDMFDKLQLSLSQDTVITPTFMVNNNFTSQSKMSVGLDFSLTLLKASFDFTVGSIGFDGFTQELKNLGNLGSLDLFNNSYSLNFSKFTGDAFTVKALDSGLPGQYALWVGLGADGNWGTTTNWQSNRPPVNGEALVFYGSGGGQTSANLEDSNYLHTVNGISFIAGAAKFDIHGHDLTNSGDIINQSGERQKIAMNLNIAANQRWDGGAKGLDYIGDLTLDGHNLSLINTRVKTVNPVIIGNTGQATLNLSAAGSLSGEELDIGLGKSSSGSFVLTGNSSQVFLNRKLVVGSAGSGHFTIENSAKMTSHGADFALAAGSQADVQVGSGAELTILGGDSNSNFAQNGNLHLSVKDGGSLLTQDIKMAASALSQAQVNVQGKGANWLVRGSLNADGLGDSRIQVNNGGILAVSKTTNVGGGGGYSELDANNGLIVLGGNLNVGDKGSINLTGQGSMANQNLLSVANLAEIGGKGISLANAGAQFQQGVKLNGALNASGSSHVDGDVLLVAGTGAIIEQSGSLTINGKVEDSGGDIIAKQSASIHFQGDVTGNGKFSGGGNLFFADGFSTGSNTASIDFGGDDITFEKSSLLSLHVNGFKPGSQYDRLQHIDQLNFHGGLMLAFSHFAADASGILDLFQFGSFSGAFASDLIQIQGLDRSRLDFTQLALSGNLIVNAAAVPLPAAFWLFGGGLFAFYAPARQNRKAAVQLDKAFA